MLKFLLTVQCHAEHERTLAAYMKYPKKREGEKGHQEAISDLYVARRKFHQVDMNIFLRVISYFGRFSLL